ncbi:molybdate ABC transporter substrate-binding protein [Brachybacterium saurashtrense]|uniref:Molybdate-binding protein ModA n=1 Tax=Brachybacterium saurashtrense TaxID=556288 RepID=A0A345YMY5_9MICO|nr:molybdate ABC transporter substrate-binding protein [Brachybacterium saurashtrense]AXK45287.1 molybdate ABC transporter substrate-binding protein [Brachybacterium saurashtrense]RRR21957.1 molybdate ABC transporter substrate-binding protein [Brachybacterium saurashtrense]
MTGPGRLARALAGAAATLLLAAACGSASSDTSGSSDDGESLTLHVHAAASLAEPFDEIGAMFEQQHPGVEVAVNYAGSSTLVEQILQGAPADVFASANTANMDKLVDAGRTASAPVDMATNTLEIAVPAGNPAGVASLEDLADPEVALVVCAPEVPCGAATRTVQEAAGLELAPVSEEQSVTDVLNKVTSGQADAGLVYTTDVRRGGDAVEGISFPEAQHAVNLYPISTVEGAAQPELGQEFVDLVTSPEGQQVLAAHGFGGP